MNPEVKLSEAISKTISAVQFSSTNGQCVLAFSDGTFATLGVERGYDAGDEEIVEESLDRFGFGDEKLERAGIVVAGELDAERKSLNDAARVRHLAQIEARDRQEFERLKAKFGGQP